jgi:hypothetical protein
LGAAVLAGAGPAAAAEGIVPAEGPWVGRTSAGLSVTFQVQERNVIDVHFGFKWGFCGTYESHLPNTDPIDATGHWSFLDSRGQTIEGTFVAPDLVEGTVVAVERELPGCPATRATFTAAPGEIPPVTKPQAYAVQNLNSGHVARRPAEIIVGNRGGFYFYGLEWQSFGGPKARAIGRAYIRKGNRVWRPRAVVRLSFLLDDGPGKRFYSLMRWSLEGAAPPGFRHGLRNL